MTRGTQHHVGLARLSRGVLTPEFMAILADAGPEERWARSHKPRWAGPPLGSAVLVSLNTGFDSVRNNVERSLPCLLRE
jgi:hypothetical protein